MRFWLGGPRIFGLRTGVSFSPNDLRQRPRQGRSQVSQASAPEGSFVYVVRSDANVCKIGISTNPLNRLAQLRTGSSYPLEFAFVGVTPGTGFEIEREAHAMLDKHRLAGEWFDVAPEMATAAVMGAAAKLGHKLHPVAPNQIGDIIAIASGAQALPGPDGGLTPGSRRVLKMIVAAGVLFAALFAYERLQVPGVMVIAALLTIGFLSALMGALNRFT